MTIILRRYRPKVCLSGSLTRLVQTNPISKDFHLVRGSCLLHAFNNFHFHVSFNLKGPIEFFLLSSVKPKSMVEVGSKISKTEIFVLLFFEGARAIFSGAVPEQTRPISQLKTKTNNFVSSCSEFTYEVYLRQT